MPMIKSLISTVDVEPTSYESKGEEEEDDEASSDDILSGVNGVRAHDNTGLTTKALVE